MANVIKRGTWWNRRAVGDLGGVTGVNQALKRLVLYWDEEGAQNIYIMSESSGTYSKPTYPLISLPGTDTYEVDFFQTEDFLFVNARKSTDARLYICMDDYAQLVRIPTLPIINSGDITLGTETFTSQEINEGNFVGVKRDASKYFQIRFAWRLKNGVHIGHSEPIYESANKAVRWNYICEGNQTIANLYDGQSLSGTVYAASSGAKQSSAPTLATDDIIELKGQTTSIEDGFYKIGATANDLIRLEGPDIVCSTITITPDTQWFYGPSEIDKKIFDGITAFMTIPKTNRKDSVEETVYKEIVRWSSQEVQDKIVKTIDLTEEKLATQNTLEGDVFSNHRFAGNTANNFNEIVALGGNYTDFALPQEHFNGLNTSAANTDCYDEVTIEVEGQTFTRWSQNNYYENSGDIIVPQAFSYPDFRATRWRVWHFLGTGNGYELVADIPLKPNPSLNTSQSFVTGESGLTDFTPSGSNQYLIPNGAGTDYVASGSTETMTDAEGTAKEALNETNLIELQKVKFSDITKFNFLHTYELGGDNFSNECVAILVNTNDISQGQFGQFPLYAFTKNRIFGFEFDTGGALFRRVVPVFSEFGAQNRDAILPLNGQILFISPRGIHVLSGNKVEDIHRPIQQHWNYYNVVGTPTTPVTDSKIFYNHKLNEVYFYNDTFQEAFVYSFRYNRWYTFDHLSSIVQQIFDEEYPYLLTTTGLINMEDESNDKVNVTVRSKPLKFTDKRDRKRLYRSFLRCIINKDDSDAVEIKLQGVIGVNNFIDLSDWTLQNTGDTSYRDLVLRHKYAPMNYFRWLLSGNLHPNSMLVSWDVEYDLRDAKLMHTWIGTGGGGTGTGGVTEFPDPPTLLTATANGTSIDLAWNDNSTNETGFEIWRSTTSGSGYARVHTTPANAVSWTDDNGGSGLSSGTYYYIVRAVNTTVQSNFSNEASATITGVCFDISTASYVSNYDVSSRDNDINDVIFNDDGSKMYVLGNQNNKVYEFDLSTSFDITSASFNQDFSLGVSLPYGIRFNPTGTRMFIMDGWRDVYEYNLSTAWDVSTSVQGNSFNVLAQEAGPHGLHFNPGGTKMFIVGSSGDEVNEYALSAAFDVTSASYTDRHGVSAQTVAPSGITFNVDGTLMFITSFSDTNIYVYSLSTGFDISTASYDSSFSIAGDGLTDPSGITFNNNGTKMYICGNSNNQVLEYGLSCS